LEGWVAGFIDGEGCFSVNINRCSVMKLGWQARVRRHARREKCFVARAAPVVLRLRLDLSECPARQPSRGCPPVVRSPASGPRRAGNPVSRGGAAAHRKVRGSGDVPPGARQNAARRPPEARRHRSDRVDRGADEPAKTIVLPENPQRLYASRLAGTGGEETVRSSWRHGEAGRNDRPATSVCS
jgi:hypothetical protein